MGYRIPEPPLDPPEDIQNADDIQELLDAAETLHDSIDNAYDLAVSDKVRRELGNAGQGISLVIDNLRYAVQNARYFEEGE